MLDQKTFNYNESWVVIPEVVFRFKLQSLSLSQKLNIITIELEYFKHYIIVGQFYYEHRQALSVSIHIYSQYSDIGYLPRSASSTVNYFKAARFLKGVHRQVITGYKVFIYKRYPGYTGVHRARGTDFILLVLYYIGDSHLILLHQSLFVRRG